MADYTTLLPLVTTVDELLGNRTVDGVTSTVRIAREEITTGASSADIPEKASTSTVVNGVDNTQYVTALGDKAALDARTTRLVQSGAATDPLVEIETDDDGFVVDNSYQWFSTPTWESARALSDLHAAVAIHPDDVSKVQFCRLRLRRSTGAYSYVSLVRNTTAGTGTGVYTVDATASSLSAYTYDQVSIELRANTGQSFRCYGGGVTEGAVYPDLEKARRRAAIATAVAAEAANRAAADASLLTTIAAMLLGATAQPPDDTLKAVALTLKRRVTINLHADSNGQHQGFGLQNGFSDALGQRWPQFASALQHTVGPIYSKQKGPYCGHECVPQDTGGSPGAFGVGGPAGIDAYACVRDGYFYQPNAGAPFGTEWYQLDAPVGDIKYLHGDLGLTLRFGYVKFPGGGQLKVVARRGTSPYTAIPLAGETTISLNAASLEYHEGVVQLPAGVRGYPVQIGFGLPAGLSVGPLVAPLWSMLEDPTRIAGWQVTSMFADGGKSMWDWARRMLDWTDEQVINYCKPIRDAHERVGQPPLFVNVFNFMLNDRNNGNDPMNPKSPSLGPGAFTDADSPEAYVDNFIAGRTRFEDVWESQGWSLDGCLWLGIGAHPLSDPEDAELTAYRAAIAAYAATTERVTAFDVTTVVTAAELPRYTSTGEPEDEEPEHLTKEGHVLEAVRILSQA